MALPSASQIKAQVELALAEDIASGDLTAALVPPDKQVSARVISRQTATIAGLPWVSEVFRQVDAGISCEFCCADGDQVNAGSILFRLTGPARTVLAAERTALNFLQTLSAVATQTRAYVEQVAGTGCHILDTRKTIPGLRLAQKYAVTCGGGVNHRIGLYDAILIKENHINAAGSIAEALQQAQQLHAGDVEIEIEVESLDEMQQALDAGAKRLLLDNFTLDQLRQAVAVNQGRARLEASGNVCLQTVLAIAQTGVDDISIGALTKNIDAVDLSMLFD